MRLDANDREGENAPANPDEAIARPNEVVRGAPTAGFNPRVQERARADTQTVAGRPGGS